MHIYMVTDQLENSVQSNAGKLEANTEHMAMWPRPSLNDIDLYLLIDTIYTELWLIEVTRHFILCMYRIVSGPDSGTGSGAIGNSNTTYLIYLFVFDFSQCVLCLYSGRYVQVFIVVLFYTYLGKYLLDEWCHFVCPPLNFVYFWRKFVVFNNGRNEHKFPYLLWDHSPTDFLYQFWKFCPIEISGHISKKVDFRKVSMS